MCPSGVLRILFTDVVKSFFIVNLSSSDPKKDCQAGRVDAQELASLLGFNSAESNSSDHCDAMTKVLYVMLHICPWEFDMNKTLSFVDCNGIMELLAPCMDFSFFSSYIYCTTSCDVGMNLCYDYFTSGPGW